MMTENNHNTRIGAFVLETLTTGMYRNPLDALREYIQNSFDSIRAAEREGFIKAGSGRIHLCVSEKEGILTLRDNGMGVAVSDIATRLVNIGMSAKSLETDAGFRGIGRLAGIAYCDKLIFRTQSHGEQIVSTATFDARALREAMSPKKREVEELAQVVDRYVTHTTDEVRKKDHFFEVAMQGINSNGSVFLSPKTVRAYLEQVAPLPLDTQSFHYSKDFYDWVEKTGVALPEVRILIDTNDTSYELFKPYKKITYSTAKDKLKVHIRGLRFFPENATKDSPFWIWYSESNCPGMIGNDAVAGLRLRKSNIAIGLSERMTDIFGMVTESSTRFNRYYIGEVHIQDPSVVPNAHRDDFEETPEWLAIREQLVLFARERSSEARALSEGRNADVEKLLSGADKELEQVAKKARIGLVSKAEEEMLGKSIARQVAKLESAEKADRPEEERKRLAIKRIELEGVQKSIPKAGFLAQNLNSSLDKKQRKIVSEILGLLYEVLDRPNFETARDAILNKYQIQQKD